LSTDVPSTRLTVRVQPRASRNEVTGFDADGVLKVRVTAPPADGQANEAVERAIADALGIGRTSVKIVRGATARSKVVEITGLGEEEVRRRLKALAAERSSGRLQQRGGKDK
jgi:uncharacterized protein (TIGR00251 family)